MLSLVVNMNTLSKLDSIPISPRILTSVRTIGQAMGQEELYRKQIPQALETLRQVAMIQSTESSNRIEGVFADHSRIVALVQEKTGPRTRDESEIAGYRKVLALIHDSADAMALTPNLLLQLHRDLFSFTGKSGGVWKATDNSITETLPDGTQWVRFQPTPAWQTPMAVQDLHDAFNRAMEAGVHDPLLLIPAYVLDFLCIHPFSDGNGRMARLITLLLLYQAGYNVGRYISLERMVEDTKEGYYETLGLSSQGWHEAAHNPVPWIEYFLGVMLQGAYQRFQDRVGDLVVSRGSKQKLLLDAIYSRPVAFTVAQLQEDCPTVSVDLIRRILNTLQGEGEVISIGRGPGAMWVKLNKDLGLNVVIKEDFPTREALAERLAASFIRADVARVVVPYAPIEALFPSTDPRADTFGHVIPDYTVLRNWAEEQGYLVDYARESAGARMRPLQFTRV